VKRQKLVEVLKFLPALFRYADAAKFVSNPNVFLTRALKAGHVGRITRGVYYNTFKEAPKVEDVACFLRTPSYISCEWALNYRGVILQVPTICSVVTLSPSVGKRNKINYRGVVIEYSKISERLFFGYDVMEDFNMAIAEKALLDAVYLRKSIPFADELEAGNLDMAKLTTMSESYPKSIQKEINRLSRKMK